MTGHPFDRLRQICMAFPAVEEKPMAGHTAPAWRVRDKLFAVGRDSDGRLSVSYKAPPGAQEVLVGAAPHRFYVPPYVGHRGWIGAWLDIPQIDWDELAGLIAESYAMTAPKRLLAARQPSDRPPSR